MGVELGLGTDYRKSVVEKWIHVMLSKIQFFLKTKGIGSQTEEAILAKDKVI